MSFSKEWEDGFEVGYSFCKMLSEVESYKGPFWPDANIYGVGSYRNGFAEGTITGRREFKVSWKWIDAEEEGGPMLVEKI